MKTRATGRMLIAALGLAAFGATAQAPPLRSTEPALPRYRIEVIVFAHTEANFAEELFDYEEQANDSYGAGSGFEELAAPGSRIDDPRSVGVASDTSGRLGDPDELAARESIVIDPLDDFSRTPEAQGDPFETLDPFGRGTSLADRRPFNFRLLRSDELLLNEEYRRIRRLDAYRPLGHAGWEQDGFDEAASKPMNLAYLGMTNPVGSLRLWVSRYLHVSVDLEYHTTRPLGGAEGAATPAGSFGLGQLATRTRYAFHMQHNAFRSGELQYIDHPMFGILVLVTPAPEEETEGVEDDTSVLRPAA